MMGGKLQSQRIQQSSPFFGIRFLLSGFDPLHHQQVKSKLVSVGAVDVGQYGPDCTHVIVHNLVFDDRICAIARRDGKTLVTNLWVDHSLDAGEPVDSTSIMYRPPKDLNGIPGAEELVMCLTGYQRQDREDIMTMVGLMGAEFSKPLVANRVTHLICYKFEGEKYELAKKMRKIKLVNHQWLEDCLKAWKVQPEEDYSKSGYELEMEAEAKDSEEETGEVAAKLTEGSNINLIPNVQNEIGGTKDHSVISNKVSSLSAQQGLSVVSTNDHMKFQIKEERKSAQASKSRSQNKMDQQSPRSCRAPDKMDAKSDSMYVENVRFLPSKQIAKELPSISGDAKSSVDFEATRFSNLSGSRKTPEKKSSLPLHVGEDLGNVSRESSKRLADSDTGKCSPSGSRKSPRRQTTGNLGNSNARMEENLTEKVIDVMCNSYPEPDKEKCASACVGVPSPEQISSSNSSKHSPPRSRRTPRRSSLSMQTARKLDNSDGKLQENSAEKVVNVCTSTAGPDKGNATSVCMGVPQIGARSLHEEGPGGSLPQKRKVDGQPDVPHSASKSQKLTTSASKRIGTTEPKTPDSNPLMKSKNSSPNLANHIGHVTAKPSSTDMSAPNVSSIKSKEKSIAASRNLASEMLLGVKSTNMASTTSHKTSIIGTSSPPSTDNKKAGEKNEQQKAFSSHVTKDLEVAKSASPKLNADDQNGNSILKPTRKKTVARKNLGSRPKLSKRSIGSGNSFEVDGALHSIGQMEGNHAKSPIDDKLKAPPIVDAPVDVEINDNAGSLDDETEAPSELDVQNDKSATNGLLLSHPDEAEHASTSPLHKTIGQAMSVAETGMKKPKLVKQNKGFSFKTKKTCLAAKEKPNDPIEAEGGKNNEEAVTEKEQVVRVTGKKRRGTLLLNKSEEAEEKQTEAPVSDDQGTSKDGKQTGKLAGRKRRGTLLLKKSEDPVEVLKENEPDLGDEGKIDDKHTGKLTTKSNLTKGPVEAEKENDQIVGNGKGTSKGGKHAGKLAGKKRRGTLVLNKSENPIEVRNENGPGLDDAEGRKSGEKQTEKSASNSNLSVRKSDASFQVQCNTVKHEPAWFLLSGHKLQRKEFQQMVKRLQGKLCRDSHQWSYQATHFIVPDPIRRTEKFFAAAASGRWILKSDYLTASSQAGKFLPEEPYEWHKNGLSEDGAINLEAPRKWRLLREKTGHGAFYGMRIIIYGECIAPPLDTLKRVVKAGDGTILATSPPYTRFLKSGVDFAVVSPGMPRVDMWVQEFLRHEIPCVLADYLVEYVCKPGYPLERHVQYNTQKWATKSFSKLMILSEECVPDAATPEIQISSDLACHVCGFSDRGEVMLICGDETSSTGCGTGTHIDCCDPPLEDVPEEDWFCPKCSKSRNKTPVSVQKKANSKRRS